MLWNLEARRGSWACFAAEGALDTGLERSCTQVGKSAVREARGPQEAGIIDIIAQSQTGPHSETLSQKPKTGLVRWMA